MQALLPAAPHPKTPRPVRRPAVANPARPRTGGPEPAASNGDTSPAAEPVALDTRPSLHMCSCHAAAGGPRPHKADPRHTACRGKRAKKRRPARPASTLQKHGGPGTRRL
ncbi:hypothetical protein PtA15_9A538 [Puccinia triticina]|uniref:Uncharacterized protein n=1 Tax=Puccinia triticina TaxID=208348 RepID=A0ABY7CT37_9BASI|nr:uncharacterized protein PtA15_9A538 [Puccinia triticina]WAQ88411.1 hypothetical protein PtA15_9A538 [Puccinia triticina]